MHKYTRFVIVCWWLCIWVGGGVSFYGYRGDGYVYDKGLFLSPKGTFSFAFVFMSLTSSKSTAKSKRLRWIRLYVFGLGKDITQINVLWRLTSVVLNNLAWKWLGYFHSAQGAVWLTDELPLLLWLHLLPQVTWQPPQVSLWRFSGDNSIVMVQLQLKKNIKSKIIFRVKVCMHGEKLIQKLHTLIWLCCSQSWKHVWSVKPYLHFHLKKSTNKIQLY